MSIYEQPHHQNFQIFKKSLRLPALYLTQCRAYCFKSGQN